jgi:uncharacterized membrane protein YheB (UPF0754 family)
MINLKILLIPILGFVIGYFTNYIAIKMLFHPRKKMFGLQGIIPKRRKILAKKISETTIKVMPENFKSVEKIPILGEKLISYFKTSIETKVNSLSDEELENLVYDLMKKEFRLVELLGGVIGFVIGCLQVLLVI